MRNKTEARDWSVFVLLAIVLTAINWSYFSHTVQGYDFFMHAKMAFSVAREGVVVTPHFLYHLVLLGVAALCADNFFLASLLIMVAANLAVFLLLCRFFLLQPICLAWAACWAFLLCVINPPQIIEWLTGGTPYQFYFGYNYLNVFHNPTITLLKPVALFLFLMVSDRDRPVSNHTMGLIGVTAILSALIKPSYVMSAAPVALLLWLLTWRRQKKSDLHLLGFWVSSFLVLTGQLILYAQFSEKTEQGARGIVFSPLTVLSTWSDHLFLKLLLSILFVLVLLWFNRDLVNDDRFVFAALTFVMACLFTYLFAETGKDAAAANFVWCAQISLFMVYAITVRRLAQTVDAYGLRVRRTLVPLVVLLFYLGGGVVWMIEGAMFNMNVYLH